MINPEMLLRYEELVIKTEKIENQNNSESIVVTNGDIDVEVRLFPLEEFSKNIFGLLERYTDFRGKITIKIYIDDRRCGILMYDGKKNFNVKD